MPARCILFCLICLVLAGCAQSNSKRHDDSEFQNGDVIFQSLRSGQSDAIQLATNSKYSHCGVVFWQGDHCYVFEAYKKVKATGIDEFIGRSKGGHYAVRRLKNAIKIFDSEKTTSTFINNFYTLFDGKPYDIYYEESDEKIYCSELIWKLYNVSSKLNIGEWKRLRDFDLRGKVVQEELKYTYGDNIPFDERIISPEALYSSDQFVTVIEK